MNDNRETKRYIVQGIYQDIVYAKNEEEAKEIFCELNANCLQKEGDFDQIVIKHTPI